MSGEHFQFLLLLRTRLVGIMRALAVLSLVAAVVPLDAQFGMPPKERSSPSKGERNKWIKMSMSMLSTSTVQSTSGYTSSTAAFHFVRAPSGPRIDLTTRLPGHYCRANKLITTLPRSYMEGLVSEHACGNPLPGCCCLYSLFWVCFDVQQTSTRSCGSSSNAYFTRHVLSMRMQVTSRRSSVAFARLWWTTCTRRWRKCGRRRLSERY